MVNAAVIVNYNDSERIVALVKKLISFSFFDYIVISDNNSNEQEITALKTLEPYDEVNLLLNGKNLGFSGGNNSALNWLKDKNVDYVFTINSDIDFERNLLVSSVGFLESHNDVAIVSADMVEGGEKKQNFYNFPTVTRAIAENLGIIKLFHIKPKISERKEDFIIVDYIRSSFWAVRYSDFKEVDFFDTNTFLYHVETCVGIKLDRVGKKSAILTKEKYFHNHVYKVGYKMRGYKDSYRSLRYIFREYYHKNRFQLFAYACSYGIGYAIRKVLRVK